MNRASLFALALILWWTTPALAQRPVIEVRLEGVGDVLVEGRLTPGGVLEVPAAPIETLTGARIEEDDFLSLDALSRALGPQVVVEYDPRLALLRLRDPSRSLPATRTRYEELTAEARATPSNIYGRGPFSAVTADSRGESLVEAGWNFGRLAINASHSTLSGNRWGVAVQPLSRTWLSYEASDGRGSFVAVRWAGGRTFARASYSTALEAARGQLGASAGPWTVFLQREPRDWSAALTFRGPMDITAAHTNDQFTTRIAFGRTASPFMLPRVR